MSNEKDDKAPDVAPAPADDVSPDAAEAAGPPAEAVENVVGDADDANPAEGEVVTEAEKSVPIHPGLRRAAAAAGPVAGVTSDEEIPLGAGVSPDWLSHVVQPDRGAH